jgi:hypothetical protein
VHVVAAFGHVRRRAALEVAVAKTRYFGQKGNAQPGFEASPQAPEPQSIHQVEEQECTYKDEEGHESPEALFDRAKMTVEVDESSPEQRLDHHTASRKAYAKPQRRGSQEAIGAEQAQQVPSRPTRGGFQGRDEVGGERCGVLLVRSRVFDNRGR